VEKLRWETFGHTRKRAISSESELVRFSTRRGFVLRHPHSGVHYPSVLEAAVGRPLLDHSWDERADEVEGWCRRSVASGQLVSTAVLGGHMTLIAPAYVPEFHRLSGNRGDLRDHERMRESGTLSPEAAAVCAWLRAEERPLGPTQLENKLDAHGTLGQRRLRAALLEAVRRMLIVEIGHDGDSNEPVYDLLPRAFHAAIEKAQATQLRVARQRVACRYLRNVIVAGSHEVARLLGWSGQDALDTLHRLVSRHMASEHPASRHNRIFFQATATDLLQ
jgi:hypothetical protein